MKKQISGGVILSFASQIITVAVGLIYTPIMIRILGEDEYGLYQMVLSIVNYLNLMNFGFGGAYIRFFSMARKKGDEDEIADINGMFLKIFLFISALCIICGAVLYFNIGILGEKISEAEYHMAKQLLVLMILNMAVTFPANLFMVYMSAKENFIFQKLLGLITNILIPLLNIPLLLLGYGSVGIVSVTLCLTIFRLAVLIWFCLKKLDMRISVKHIDINIFNGLMGYSFYIFLSDFVDQLNTNVDKFLLGRMIGMASVTVYSIGFSLKNYYTMVSWIIPEMYIPETNRIAVAEQDDKKLTELFARIGRYNNYILLLVLTGFVLVGREFIHLWVGDDYETAYIVCVILMLSAYIPSVQTLGVNIQNAKNMHQVRSVVYFLIACINVAASVFLIKRWGEVGTSLGTFFAVVLGCGFFMNFYYYKYIKLNIFYFWKELIKWIIPASVLFMAAYAVRKAYIIDSWMKLIVIAAAYAGCYLILLWLFGLKKEEKLKIKSLIHRHKIEK